jgi:ribose transport system substrate-binding protein
MKTRALWVMVLGFFLVSLAAFGAGPVGSKKPGNYVVGISNSTFGNLWREKHIAEAVAVANEYIKRGWLKSVIVQQSGPDVQVQIQQIRNMINQKVSMILINPASATGLVGVIEEAKEAGIPCICMDAEMLGADRKLALSVATDKFNEAYTSMKYVAQAIGGKGKVILLLGIAGDQPTMKRMEGAKAVLKEFPNLELLTTAYASYNQSTAESVMNDLISTYPKIDAVFTIGSMGMGVLRAFENAGRPLPAISGDPTYEFALYAKKQRDSGVKFIYACPANPPGIGGTAMHIAAYLLNGYVFKPGVLVDNEYFYPVKAMITPETLDHWLDYFKGQDPSAWISEVAGEDLIKTLLQ